MDSGVIYPKTIAGVPSDLFARILIIAPSEVKISGSATMVICVTLVAAVLELLNAVTHLVVRTPRMMRTAAVRIPTNPHLRLLVGTANAISDSLLISTSQNADALLALL
jgi:hypothetical protein